MSGVVQPNVGPRPQGAKKPVTLLGWLIRAALTLIVSGFLAYAFLVILGYIRYEPAQIVTGQSTSFQLQRGRFVAGQFTLLLVDGKFVNCRWLANLDGENDNVLCEVDGYGMTAKPSPLTFITAPLVTKGVPQRGFTVAMVPTDISAGDALAQGEEIVQLREDPDTKHAVVTTNQRLARTLPELPGWLAFLK